MPRRQYPSDRNRGRPFARVDLRARTHRIAAPVFADPLDRGIIVGLWMLGRENWAARTDDVVTLTHADLVWLTGRERPTAALTILARACARMGYQVWIHAREAAVPSSRELVAELLRDPCRPGDDPVSVPRQFGAVSVHVRNLAKKQKLTPHTPQDPTRSSTPEEESRSTDREREQRPNGLSLSGVYAAVRKQTRWSEDQVARWWDQNKEIVRREGTRQGVFEGSDPQAGIELLAIRYAKAERNTPRREGG